MNKSNNELKILFLGLDGSGKSTIIARLRDFKNEEIVEIYPTPFIKVDTIQIDTKKITVIEISGQQRYRNYCEMFYQEVQGIVFVIDGTDQKRLKLVKELIQKIDKDLGRKMPVVFLVNKQDTDGALNKGDIKEYIDLDRLDSNFIWTMKYYE